MAGITTAAREPPMSHLRRRFPIQAAAAMLACGAAAADPVSLHVLSATVRDQGIAGAEVLLQKNGQPTVQGYSDAGGNFLGSPPFPANDSATTLIIRKPGYSTLVAKCPCDGLSYAISPVMQQLDGLRVVLNWGAAPRDLDAHLVSAGEHVYWNQQQGDDSTLDVDQRNGYGPETITIRERQGGRRYVYAVHDFSDRTLQDSNALELGRPQVRVYVGQTLVRSYEIDPARKGNLWTVFAINEDGAIEDLDRYSDAASPDQEIANALGGSLSGALPAPVRRLSAAGRQQALESNRNGESAYARHDYDMAIKLFQRAVELDPDYGQAYSNLGLSFQKAGNEAEAIWADRKALALASGPDAPRVRAASWYNIARIYEAKSEWAKARDSYRAAENERHNEIYVAAIGRMEEKLK
jgi:hypothetical protein